jgi:phytoene desaturase
MTRQERITPATPVLGAPLMSDTKDPRPRAVVIGAGLGGLASAMRLGAKGYAVTVLDKLDRPGGRGSSISKGGHRFDLGPTIVTVPKVFEDLWSACGRDFHADVDLRPVDPFYEIRWPDGSHFTARQDTEAMRAEVARLSPGDLKGYDRFLRDAEKRYWFGFENLGRRSMHELWELIKVLPIFGMLRADRSVYGHAARRVKDERLRMALSFHPLFIGGDPFHVTSMYILVSYLEKEFGVHYAMGGVQAIADAMARVIEDQGGLVRLGVEADEILLKDGRAAGVRLADGETLPARVVVSNADAGHTYGRLMRNHPRKRWTSRHLARRRWSMGLFVWYFGTRGTRELWPDVGHHTIVSGPRYKGLVNDIFIKGKLAEDMSLYVHRPSVVDPSVAPAGDDTFYVLSPVPHLGHPDPVDWEAMRDTYRENMLGVLEERLLPAVPQNLDNVKWDYAPSFSMPISISTGASMPPARCSSV